MTAVMGILRNEKLHNLYSAPSNHIKNGKMEGRLIRGEINLFLKFVTSSFIVVLSGSFSV